MSAHFELDPEPEDEPVEVILLSDLEDADRQIETEARREEQDDDGN